MSSTSMPIAGTKEQTVAILPKMANRHGCITGATGTGKTVTLQVLAEAFSNIGTAVFAADVKGDLSGIAAAAKPNEKLASRLEKLSLPEPKWGSCPVTFWDIFGAQGHPVRATVSDLGPMLLAQILNLNDTQQGVLDVTFKLADDQGWLILDMKDLRSTLQYVADNAADIRIKYGQISKASIGAIQRNLLRLESEGAEQFFGEPMLDVFDWIRTDTAGRGMINVLAADRLMQSPRLYAIFLLWMLADLYERLPEVGDLSQPKLVFFFDEAHLLFKNAPKSLVEKIEQIVRLVRSKSVGVYFVTQSPSDIPDSVLGQLGHRIQHALRAYTPRDQKSVRAAAQTMRPNPGLDIESAITSLGVGEALVSVLDEKGQPTPTERVWIYAPGSQIGSLSDSERKELMAASMLGGKYDTPVDRESAYEILAARAEKQAIETEPDKSKQEKATGGSSNAIQDFLFGSTGPRGGRRDGVVQSVTKSVVRQTTNRIVRGIIGSLLGRR